MAALRPRRRAPSTGSIRPRRTITSPSEIQQTSGQHRSRYADLLFEVVTHRYEARRPIALTTNKAFADWADVFPHAASVVTLVDRLTHRAEVITLEGKSYRLKESEELAEGRKRRRKSAHRDHA